MTGIVRFWTIVFAVNTLSLLWAQIPATTNDGKKVILYENGVWQYADNIKSYYPYFPKITSPPDILIHHTAYSLVYDTVFCLARWVMYELKKEHLQSKGHERTNRFIPDPFLPHRTNLEATYKNSGFDRGHLVPAADMAYSEITMKESFYFSNITPQSPSFNRGIWKKLEEQVRNWAITNECLYVVTGAVVTDTMKRMGSARVGVPDYFYKIIADLTLPEMKMIGFIIPNKKSDMDLKYYAVSVDSVEKITRIDFFPQLPDETESKLENEINLKMWWK